jgi:lipopolysaccharide biosynthesis regulator YciM
VLEWRKPLPVKVVESSPPVQETKRAETAGGSYRCTRCGHRYVERPRYNDCKSCGGWETVKPILS